MNDDVIDLAEARRRLDGRQEVALLALFSGVLGKPLVRRDLTPEQQAARETRAAQLRQQRRDRIGTATGTIR